MKTIYYFEDYVKPGRSTLVSGGQQKICVLCEKIDREGLDQARFSNGFAHGGWVNLKTHEVYRCIGESILESEFPEKALKDTIAAGTLYEQLHVTQPEFISTREIYSCPIVAVLKAASMSKKHHVF